MSLDLLQPDWPVTPHVRSACSLRAGGVSASPYDSLNLGDHVGDDAKSVAENRARYAQALGAKPVYLTQVHGWDVVQLDFVTPDSRIADACITTQSGVACTIMVADCLPVLFANRAGTVVGAAHAGWRGLCGQAGEGVLEHFLKHFKQLAGIESTQRAMNLGVNDVFVWLGPCIGPDAFEVGEDVRHAFVSVDPLVERHFKPAAGGKYLGDLQGLARQRLAKLGVTQIYGNDGSTPWCTVSNPSNFFSHRRDRISGRFAASVWLV